MTDATKGPGRPRWERRVSITLAGLALGLGGLQTWANRFAIWPDLLSYVELGEAWARGSWADAVSGHWSPLYSWVLGLALAAPLPSSAHELAVVKLVDFLLFAASLGSFLLLLRELAVSGKVDPGEREARRLPATVLLAASHAVFLWASLRWLVVYRDTPDVLVAALTYLAAALVLRARRTGSARAACLLGLTLGLAYLAKTAMLPIAFAFLVGAAVPVSGLRVPARRTLLALVWLLAVSLPLAGAISVRLGRPSIGESGRLNYAWLVNPKAPNVNWQGLPPGSGTPRHPTRKLLETPATFEFTRPIAGSYPPWYDPAYWNEGLRPGFDWAQERRIVWRNLGHCWRLFGGALAVGFFALALLGGRPRASLAGLVDQAPILVPGLAGLGVFVIGTILPAYKLPWGHLQTRYFAPFVVLLFLGALAAVRVTPGPRPAAWARLATLAASALALSWLGLGVAREARAALVAPSPTLPSELADRLRALGLEPGDRVGVVGVEPYPSLYWARLARVRIVAQVDARGFWTADEETRRQVLEAVARVGARALVSPPPRPGSKRPRDPGAQGWSRLGTSDYFALLIGR